MGETTVTLYMVLIGTENLLNTLKSVPLLQILKELGHASGNSNVFKASKLVNREAERGKNQEI